VPDAADAVHVRPKLASITPATTAPARIARVSFHFVDMKAHGASGIGKALERD
jgi:hypothetical protein